MTRRPSGPPDPGAAQPGAAGARRGTQPRPAGARVTLREVAQRAGVSRSAVSRTFTEGAPISEETRRKVLQAAHDLGYSPNLLASSLTTGRTRLIGLVADNFTNPAFLGVIDRFTRALDARGFRPLLVNLAGQTDPAASVQLLARYSVEGVILASSTLPQSFAQAFRQAGLPVVHAFGRTAGDAVAHVVGVDNVRAGEIAAAALIGRGYRRLGFLGGPEPATSTEDRLAGFRRAALAVAGVGIEAAFASAYSHEAGRKAMAALIARGGLAQAYFCGDDMVAIGAMDALAEAGLGVPGDVGLIGMNDVAMAGWRSIGLSTIRQPFDEIICAAIDLVLALIADPGLAPEVRILPCTLVERRTLGRV